jgi:hypothetical protein
MALADVLASLSGIFGSGTPLRVGGLGGIVDHPGDLGLHRVNGSSGRGLPTFAARLSDDEVAPTTAIHAIVDEPRRSFRSRPC